MSQWSSGTSNFFSSYGPSGTEPRRRADLEQLLAIGSEISDRIERRRRGVELNLLVLWLLGAVAAGLAYLAATSKITDPLMIAGLIFVFGSGAVAGYFTQRAIVRIRRETRSLVRLVRIIGELMDTGAIENAFDPVLRARYEIMLSLLSD